MRTVFFVYFVLLAGVTIGADTQWLGLGNDASNHSLAVDSIDGLTGNLAWVGPYDQAGPTGEIKLVGPSCPVVFGGRVFVYAKYYDDSGSLTNNQIVAFDAETGNVEWSALVDLGVRNSWSSPAVYAKNNSVLIGSGYNVFSFDAVSGGLNWEVSLYKPIVNASVCVADDLAYGRAFITDYSSTTGKLYCVNLDPNDVVSNPFEPGEVVWSAVIGETSGNTPAYKDGVVYVGCIEGVDSGVGTVYAFDAGASEAIKLWECSDNSFEGFFSGVTVTKAGYVYGVNYDFSYVENNSTMCKIDSTDGTLIWTIDTERTDSIPVVVGDTVYVSGGLRGYGSRPKLSAFVDRHSWIAEGATVDPNDYVEMLWETKPSQNIGGWTHQPAYADGKIYVGAVPAGEYSFNSYTDLYIIDAAKDPNDVGFIVDHYAGCGSSPAVTHENVYSIGSSGLHKFNTPALLADIVKDGRVNFADFSVFMAQWRFDGPIGVNRSDLNLDGYVNVLDLEMFIDDWLEDLN